MDSLNAHYEGDGGGDLHFMSVCSHDLIFRMALADVSGHGRAVDAATMKLHGLMRKNIDVWDQSDFMRGLNDTFNRDCLGPSPYHRIPRV